MIDNKQIAEALRLAATYLGSGLHDNAVESLQRQANALDPPYKVDRSLRGWVLVVNRQGQKSMMYADANGIGYWSEHGTRFSWDDVELYGWKVTKLRILQPGQTAVGSALIREAFTLLRSARYDISADKLEEILEVDELERMDLDSPESELEREKNL